MPLPPSPRGIRRREVAALIFAASQECDKGDFLEGGFMGDPKDPKKPVETPEKPEEEDEEEEDGTKASAQA